MGVRKIMNHFVVNPFFGCGFAALRRLWLNFFSPLIAALTTPGEVLYREYHCIGYKSTKGSLHCGAIQPLAVILSEQNRFFVAKLLRRT